MHTRLQTSDLFEDYRWEASDKVCKNYSVRLMKMSAVDRHMGRENVNVESLSRLDAVVHGSTLNISMAKDNADIGAPST